MQVRPAGARHLYPGTLTLGNHTWFAVLSLGTTLGSVPVGWSAVRHG